MEISGTIYRILQSQEVTFNDGSKKIKGGFVIMRDGDYPKTVAFELFGEERLSMLNGLTFGAPVRVSFYAESREGKEGKFYTTLRCTNVMPLVAGMMPSAVVSTIPTPTTPNYGQWPPMPNTENQQPTMPQQENDLPWGDDNPPF